MRRARLLGVSCVIGALSSALAAPSSAMASHLGGHQWKVIPQTAPVVEYWSDDQIAMALHEPRAAVSGKGGSRTQAEAFSYARAAAAREEGVHQPFVVPPGGADEHWYSIISQTKDWSGTDLPTRWGDYSHFGYNKIVLVHGITDTDIIEAPYHGTVDVKSGTNWTYYGVVTVNGYPKTALTTVASLSHTSIYGATPDKRNVGTITAYCNNSSTQECPDYIP